MVVVVVMEVVVKKEVGREWCYRSQTVRHDMKSFTRTIYKTLLNLSERFKSRVSSVTVLPNKS
ncbi:hypothetical protein E2C01_095172 [Portunus trituberculatus]|uniref:Uncharacterized protein n=1 Tax=Portunus trituberculatus TaxID=210409 RepID=A0A5B7JSF2_PORTR|nr:hypothetical protein [Portunus trituberculatus]